MSLFNWRRAQQPVRRSLTWETGGSPWHVQAGYDQPVPNTMEGALQIIAVRSAIDLLASLASELPLDVFSGKGEARVKRPTPGYLDDPAGDGMGREDWAYQVLESWMLRGNMFGLALAQAPSGFPTQVELLHPDRVSGTLVDGAAKWTVNGRDVDQSKVIHRRVNPMPGQVLGLSPIGLHMLDLGLSVATTRFGLQYFTDSGVPSILLKNEIADIKEEQRRDVKKAYQAAMSGVREPLVMGRGWSFEALSINPEESQFLETRGYSAAECCRMFGPGVAELLGYESGGSMTYANVDSRLLHLLILSLDKWINRLERLYTFMLPRPQEVKLNRAAILQTTTMQRYLAHASALQNQWKTPDEIRALEDQPPLPDGLGALPIKAGASAAPNNDNGSEPDNANPSAPPKEGK